MNDMKYAAFSANWQPGVPKYNWVNWQWAGFTNHNKHRHSGRTAHIQRRITNYSIVFQINKYVNLACFLNICKHIMVFLCFSRVKILHTAPLKFLLRNQKTQQYMYVYMLMHYKSSCTVPQPAADSQCFSLHMYSIYVKHSYSLYSCIFIFYL